MAGTVESNLACLLETLEFNRKHELFFFRISSDLIPFASHPVCEFPWQKVYKKTFREIGDFIKKTSDACLYASGPVYPYQFSG
jgi:UV DNA damage endonuclease